MENEICEWHLDDEEMNAWESACGLVWCLNEGTPKENEMAYCPKCGRHLTQSAADVCPDGRVHDWSFLNDDDIEVCVNCGTRR